MAVPMTQIQYRVTDTRGRAIRLDIGQAHGDKRAWTIDSKRQFDHRGAQQFQTLCEWRAIESNGGPVIELLVRLRKKTGLENLCLCGGVAFNSVMNGRILRERIFERVYIPPAAGDAGVCGSRVRRVARRPGFVPVEA